MKPTHLSFIHQPKTALWAALFSVSVSLIFSGLVALLTLIVFCLLVLWSVQWDWSYFGLHRTQLSTLIVKALIWSVIIVVFAFLSKPMLEAIFGPQDLSFFDPIRGNRTGFILTSIQVWTLVAFFEEFIFRGYFMLQIERYFKGSNWGWIAGVLMSSIVFGIAHNYQGLTGTVLTGIIGAWIGLIYYFQGRNLWLCILVHGLVDTLYISLVYTSYDLQIIQWVNSLLSTS